MTAIRPGLRVPVVQNYASARKINIDSPHLETLISSKTNFILDNKLGRF